MRTDSVPSEYKKSGRLFNLLQSLCICVLIVFVVFMMLDIGRLQGTARVINYAGLVRGATQRLVKLEMAGSNEDDLVLYLDEVLNGLKYGNGTYDLVSLKDDVYQTKLDNLMAYWDALKDQIAEVRKDSNDQQKRAELLEMSETYFTLADKTVSAAEVYSDEITRQIQAVEIISAIDMGLLFLMIIKQSIDSMRVRSVNVELEQKAYIDTQTGLQNKNMCEERLNRPEAIVRPTACLMFDINNLKLTNDTLGHTVGDRLIADFASCILKVTDGDDFAGRCGGDEFIIIMYDISGNSVNEKLTRLRKAVEELNSSEGNVPVSYAEGWAVSTAYKKCTYRMLFDEADQCMYENKRKYKEYVRIHAADERAQRGGR